ncbi:hypothetical protein GOBAR_DD27155 [Gossypium barbadense]|nr:hypothetical protein GOBAR_DD27155 [Gossypium barbadense]
MDDKDYKEEPDYGRYVAIVASASLREMIKPGALAIISPIVVAEETISSHPKLDRSFRICEYCHFVF